MKASEILCDIKIYLPDIYNSLEIISDAFGKSNEYEILQNVYPTIRSISIDYGVMEKVNNLWVIPGDFGWNDIGSWETIDVIRRKDDTGNVLIGDTICVETSNSVIYSTSKTIATFGIDNLVVVEADDSIMVCKKDDAQNVKKIVEEIKKRNRNELL